MPDLLGAANPVPGYDKSVTNRNIPVQPEKVQIQNAPDLTRVNRGDRRSEWQQSSQESNQQIRYDSNFQTFLQRLQNTPSLTESLSKMFFVKEGTVVLSGMSDGISEEMGKILQMLQMDQKQLLEFLTGQFKTGSRFNGALFALLRNAYANAGSETVRGDILQFLKSYLDYASTGHIENNILRDLGKMTDAMPASWAEQLQEMIAQLKNSMAAGDRQGSLSLLQKGIYSYISRYIEQTHDMGLPRQLSSLLALNLTRYENGSVENLLEAFHQLSGYGTLKNTLGKIDDQSLLMLLRSSQANADSKAVQFANQLAELASKGLRGSGGVEAQQAFQNLISAMLINESVYMPINHYLLPLQWEDRMLFSELWVDPNAEDGDGKPDGRNRKNTVKILMKLDVQGIGLFDVVLMSRDTTVDLQVFCPAPAVSFSKQIEGAISEILVRNALQPGNVTVRRMERPVNLTEVFPRIFEGRNSINVKI